jgi:hypothetical protein
MHTASSRRSATARKAAGRVPEPPRSGIRRARRAASAPRPRRSSPSKEQATSTVEFYDVSVGESARREAS